MKRYAIVFLLCIFAFSPLLIPITEAGVNLGNSPNVQARLKNIRIPFVVNRGQTHPDVAFYAQTFAGPLFVTKSGKLVLSIPANNDNGRQPVVITETLKNADTRHIAGELPAISKVHYFIGSDPQQWRKNIPSYEVISFGEIYAGIELKLKAYGNNIEKFFYIQPGSNASSIQIAVNGAERMDITENGMLSLETRQGAIRYTRPRAYQLTDGKRHDVDVNYRLTSDGYSFRVGDYDKNRELVIDPMLQSTYLGGTNDETAWDLAIHPLTGDVYVTGETLSADFPGAVSNDDLGYSGSKDAFIARIDGSLTGNAADPAILSIAYLGGSDDDGGRGIAIAGDGVYITGYSRVTSGDQVLVARLSIDLATLNVIRTFGGSAEYAVGRGAHDTGEDITVDGITGTVYVVGKAGSRDFPTTDNAYQRSWSGAIDGFVARLTGLLGSVNVSYLGGSGNDIAYSVDIAVDPADGKHYLFVTGYTGYNPRVGIGENDFPGVTGGAQGLFGGAEDAFIARFEADLKQLAQATYVGGGGVDRGHALTIHGGNVYVAGYTSWTTYDTGAPLIETFIRDPDGSGPVEPEDLQGAYPEPAGSQDNFLVRLPLSLTLSADTRVTYYGGLYNEIPYDLAINPVLNNLYVMGTTNSHGLPGTAGSAQASFGGLYLANFSSDLEVLNQATYVGGELDTTWGGLGLYPATSAAQIYVSGQTFWSEFPETAGGVLDTLSGPSDAFVARFDATLTAPGDADIDVHPLSIEFDNTVLGSPSNPETVTIGNIGGATLSINNMEILGSDDFNIDYGISPPWCQGVPAFISPFTYCKINVTFTPAAAGNQTATLRISSDDRDEPAVDITINGSSLPDIKVLPALPGEAPVVQFTDTFVDSSAVASFSIGNEGGVDLVVSEISLFEETGVGTGDNFSLQFGGPSPGCPEPVDWPFTVPVGELCTVGVTYAPESIGDHQASATIDSNDPDESSVTVRLTGHAVAIPEQPITLSSIDFGHVDVGSHKIEIAILSNKGPDSVTITGYTLSNTDFSHDAAFDSSFGCGGGMFSGILPSGTSCGIEVTFSPTVVESYCETLTVLIGMAAEVSGDLTGRSGADSDADCHLDTADNCSDHYNPAQADGDRDGLGDACDCDDCIHGANENDVDCGGMCSLSCNLCGSYPTPLPDQFSWHHSSTEKGWLCRDWMTPVGDQMEPSPCGSCWAFSVLGAVEAKYNIENADAFLSGTLPALPPPLGRPTPHDNELDLSEQTLVSPCYAGGTCNGGWPSPWAFDFVKNTGVPDEECFENVGGDVSWCDRCGDWEERAWKIGGHREVRDCGRSVTETKWDLVCNGPVVSCHYNWWDPGVSHCIVIAGWDESDETWLVKNSWGTDWPRRNDDGFGKVPYGHDWTHTGSSEVCEKWYPYGVYGP